MAVFLLYDLFNNILPHWDFLYSGHGVMTAAERHTNIFWSFFGYTDNPVVQNTILLILVIALGGLLIGYHARLCCFISFLIFFAIMDRVPQADSGADILANCLMAWGSFLPLDRYYSLAAALREDAEREKSWPVVMAAGYKIQIIIVYLYAGLFKLAGAEWLDGKAIKYAVSDQIYGSSLGETVIRHIPDNFMAPLCWGVIIFQLTFSLLVYMPWRNDVFRALALAGAVIMHLAFLFLLHVNMFPFLCLIYLILLVPDRWLEKALAGRQKKNSNIRIYYDPDCGFCRKVSYIFREFCLGDSAKISPASENAEAYALLKKHDSWVVFGHEGKTYLKWDAVAYVLKQSPVFWSIGLITGAPLFRKPMSRLYDLIGRNRMILGKVMSSVVRAYPEEKPERMTQFFCLYMIFCMILYATATLPQVNVELPDHAKLGVRQMGVQQTWDLFAPDVPSWKWNMRIEAFNQDDGPIDLDNILYRHFSHNVDHYDFYSHRVLKFYTRMFSFDAQHLHRGYARYLCHETARTGKPASKISLEFLLEHKFEARDKLKFSGDFACRDLVQTQQ